MASPQTLIEKIKTLPSDRLGEVENFVDFIVAKTLRLAAMDRLLAIAPSMEGAGASTITEDEVLAEVEAVRTARRLRSDAHQAGDSARFGADRS